MRRVLYIIVLLCSLLPWLAHAQTRVWLDRSSVTLGETVALNIETDQSLQAIDYSPLQQTFDVGGQSVRRSFSLTNGRSTSKTVFSVGLRPRRAGALTVPALRIGNQMGPTLQLQVLQPTAAPASNKNDVFVELEADTLHPYVQQTVAVTVRLNYAVPLASGQLDLPPPDHGNLQRVGEDVTYQRDLGGRRYQVVERRFSLIPDRSGELLLPGARFNGVRADGNYDLLFSSSRQTLSAASPALPLQVRAIPAAAPQPWLPLRNLTLRWLQTPKQAFAGQAVTLEYEMEAISASAAQLQPVQMPKMAGATIFAEPARKQDAFVDDGQRAVLQQVLSVVPTHAGTLTIPGPEVRWWDAVQGVARVAKLPALELQVAAGAITTVPQTQHAESAPSAPSPTPVAKPAAVKANGLQRPRIWHAVLTVLAVLLVVYGVWLLLRMRNRLPQVVTLDAGQQLTQALAGDDLAAIVRALVRAAGVNSGDLDDVGQRLASPQQQAAVRALQKARWGSGNAASALAQLRTAFASGVELQKTKQGARSLLPPLYPK